MKKKNKVSLNPILQALLFIGFIILALVITFGSTNVFGMSQMDGDLESIKTALAGTAQALLGPFPTQTLPTKTASSTPTATPLISATPTFTASVTFTHVPTRTLMGTATVPVHNIHTRTPTAVPTRTLLATRTPTRFATRTPTRFVTRTPTPRVPPTYVNTNTPIPPTKTRTPPRPTSTPRPTETTGPTSYP